MTILSPLPTSDPDKASFGLDLMELVEEAFERAGGELRSGYDIRTAKRSLHLLLAEWANRGLNLWTIEQTVEFLVADVSSYALVTDTVDVLDAVIRVGSDGSPQDHHLDRMSAAEYTRLMDKGQTGQPRRVWFNRTVEYPVATLWPVPDRDYVMVYWRLRRMADVLSAADNPGVPFRFLPALTAGLAFYIAQKIPQGASRITFLKAEYEQAWIEASREDREKSSLYIVPRGWS